MGTVKNYLSLIKFSHTIFALPFALIGFFLAAKHRIVEHNGFFAWNSTGMGTQKPIWLILVLVLFCMVFARSAAMAFNRYLDRDIDAQNPRTAVREIPAGILTHQNVLWFTVQNAALFILCSWFINPLCFYLSPVALFIILLYSYTKRFTAICHLVLGLGLSLAPVGAYIAVTESFDLLPILFSFTVLFWVSGFDIIYALQDEAFDKSYSLHSIPVKFGKSGALNISTGLHVLSAAAVIGAGFYGNFGIFYWIGLAAFVGMLIYQHTLVSPNNLTKVNLAFMTTNGMASVLFSIFVILDLFI